LKTRLEELDQENQAYRVRVQKEMERRFELEKLALLTSFLEVVDNMERALESSGPGGSLEALKEGVELNLQLLQSKLKSNGVEQLEVIGSPFDPHESEAVGTVPTDHPEEDQLVLEVLQHGYRCGDQLLRPARVRIGQIR
jgi:molecular chaperone GrpE